MEKEKYEVRYANGISIDNGVIKGTAIVFNSLSEDLGGFREIIKCNPTEVKQLLDSQDIVMLYNHNQNSTYNVLARSKNGKGSLNYSVDEFGVHFEFKAKTKDAGIVESIESGDLDGCSFAFQITENQQKIEKINGEYIRSISGFKGIKDFSIVVTPAYSATSVSLRALEDFKNGEIEAIKNTNDDEEKRQLEEVEKERLYKIYLNNQFKKYLM